MEELFDTENGVRLIIYDELKKNGWKSGCHLFQKIIL
jgi:hypothetical protein